MRPDIKARLSNAQKLPTIPAVVIEILQTCQREDFCVEDLAQVIRSDPALSVKLLKIVNSPIFGISRTVSTVSDALVWLGVNAVRTIALSLSVISSVRGDSEAFDYPYFWKRSLLSAMAARQCAEVAGFGNKEEVFLNALLQDIGVLALVEGLGEDYRAIARRAGHDHQALVRLEREELGTDHAEIGAWLARRWSLPAEIIDTIRLSHSGTRSNPTADQVQASGWIADIWLSDDVHASTAEARAIAEELLDIDPEQFEALLQQIAEALPEMTSLFDVQIGSEEDITAILEQARETLMLMSLQSVLSLESQNREIEERSQRDPLTGLYNRSHLEHRFERAFLRSSQQHDPLSVLFCDIDYFKTINDTYGHQVGDDILKGVAHALERELGAEDTLARFGGEEFVILLPNSSTTHARVLGERIRSCVRGWSHSTRDGKTIRVTISIGSATHNDQHRFPHHEQLLEAADKALYNAKRDGRDRVVAFEDSALAQTQLYA